MVGTFYFHPVCIVHEVQQTPSAAKFYCQLISIIGHTSLVSFFLKSTRSCLNVRRLAQSLRHGGDNTKVVG